MDIGHTGGGDLAEVACAGGYRHGGRPRCSGERKVGMGNRIWVAPEDMRWPGNSKQRQRPNVLSGGALRCGRGGEEGGDGWCEVRHGRGAFYRCQGGGRRPDDRGAEAAPLMVVVN
jgi:hypothetical protein